MVIKLFCTSSIQMLWWVMIIKFCWWSIFFSNQNFSNFLDVMDGKFLEHWKKIIFLGLSDNTTIFHYVNKTTNYTESKMILKEEYTSPFIFNITITRSKSLVSIAQLTLRNIFFPFFHYRWYCDADSSIWKSSISRV